MPSPSPLAPRSLILLSHFQLQELSDSRDQADLGFIVAKTLLLNRVPSKPQIDKFAFPRRGKNEGTKSLKWFEIATKSKKDTKTEKAHKEFLAIK